MSGRMTRRRHDEYVAALGNRHLFRKWTVTSRLESKQFRLPPFRPLMWQIPLQDAADALRSSPLDRMHPRPQANEMCETTGMIGVKVGQDHMANVACVHAHGVQLRANLVFGPYAKRRGSTEKRMPAWMVAA